MIADHMIKVSGVWYRLGDKIPSVEPQIAEVAKVEEKPVEVASAQPKKRGRRKKTEE